jgi:hypothetical protein
MVGIKAELWQQQMLRSKSKRMLINCSRQAGKSTTASILALHRALYHPKSVILLVSPSLRQSAELFRKVMLYLNALEPRPVLTEESATKLTLENGSRIVSLPASEDTVRGYSAVDLIIEDEAAKVHDALYESVRPMVIVSKGRLILMSTPFGQRGHFHKEWTESTEAWERISVTGDQCPHIPAEELAAERARGDWWYRQEYNCEFLDTDDQAFASAYVDAAFRNDVPVLAL